MEFFETAKVPNSAGVVGIWNLRHLLIGVQAATGAATLLRELGADRFDPIRPQRLRRSQAGCAPVPDHLPRHLSSS